MSEQRIPVEWGGDVSFEIQPGGTSAPRFRAAASGGLVSDPLKQTAGRAGSEKAIRLLPTELVVD